MNQPSQNSSDNLGVGDISNKIDTNTRMSGIENSYEESEISIPGDHVMLC